MVDVVVVVVVVVVDMGFPPHALVEVECMISTSVVGRHGLGS